MGAPTQPEGGVLRRRPEVWGFGCSQLPRDSLTECLALVLVQRRDATRRNATNDLAIRVLWFALGGGCCRRCCRL